MPNYVRQVALSSLVLGLMACAQGQPAQSPEAATPANEQRENGAPAEPGTTPPVKAEKQQNDGSGSGSPLPESKTEQAAPSQTRRDPEQWSQVNLLCGASPPRREAAALWP
jgi:hypothetical protein